MDDDGRSNSNDRNNNSPPEPMGEHLVVARCRSDSSGCHGTSMHWERAKVKNRAKAKGNGSTDSAGYASGGAQPKELPS